MALIKCSGQPVIGTDITVNSTGAVVGMSNGAQTISANIDDLIVVHLYNATFNSVVGMEVFAEYSETNHKIVIYKATATTITGTITPIVSGGDACYAIMGHLNE